MSDTPKQDALATRPQRTFSLMPGSLGEAMEMATLIANSDFAPKDYKGKPSNVLIAIQMGADIGLRPMQAVQNIAIINGRPSIYGDAALALVMPALERFVESFEGTPGQDDYTAVCIAKRKGWPDETRRTFSIADAKKANLWGKSGPWSNYPSRMQQFRARGFCLRDLGADLLLGLVLAEEAMDYPAIEGSVISSEVVESGPVTLLDKLPDALRDNVEKAFSTLNLAPGLRLAKINEFMGGDGVDPEAGAQQILDWARDEFAKRKTGQPRRKKDEGNGKTAVSKEGSATVAEAAGPKDPSLSEPVAPATTAGEPVTVPESSDLF